MARIFVEYLVPLLLPTALYALWLAWQRRGAAAAGNAPPAWQEGPWFWLAMAGAAFAFAVIVATILFASETPKGKYVPPALKNGVVVPGHFEG